MRTRTYPLGEQAHVVIDSGICWGSPTIKGTRITTDNIYGMWKAGDSLPYLARIYDITNEQVSDAIIYEQNLLKDARIMKKTIEKPTKTLTEAEKRKPIFVVQKRNTFDAKSKFKNLFKPTDLRFCEGVYSVRRELIGSSWFSYRIKNLENGDVLAKITPEG